MTPTNPARNRVRFREGSTFARDFKLSPGQRGTITHRYLQDDHYRVDLHLDGGLYCMGVPVDDLVVHDDSSSLEPSGACPVETR